MTLMKKYFFMQYKQQNVSAICCRGQIINEIKKDKAGY